MIKFNSNEEIRSGIPEYMNQNRKCMKINQSILIPGGEVAQRVVLLLHSFNPELGSSSAWSFACFPHPHVRFLKVLQFLDFSKKRYVSVYIVPRDRPVSCLGDILPRTHVMLYGIGSTAIASMNENE